MSVSSYTRFVKILEKWPLDPQKKGKDVGEALRQLFSREFPLGSTSVVNEKHINRYTVISIFDTGVHQSEI